MRTLPTALFVLGLSLPISGLALNEFEHLPTSAQHRLTDQLGNRKFGYFRGSYRFSPWREDIRIVVGNDVATCRKYAVKGSGAHTVILFKPGTTQMVGYVGEGKCLTEPPFDDPEERGGELLCAEHHEQAVAVDGYAWPFEASNEAGREALSERRVAAVKRQLQASAFTSNVVKNVAHGSSRTTVPVDQNNPVFGVSLSLVDGDDDDPSGLSYLQSRTEAWTESEFERIRRLIDEIPERDVSSMNCWPRSSGRVIYRSPDGDEMSLTGECGNPQAPAYEAINDWVSALIQNDCDFAKSKSLEHYLSEAL